MTELLQPALPFLLRDDGNEALDHASGSAANHTRRNGHRNLNFGVQRVPRFVSLCSPHLPCRFLRNDAGAVGPVEPAFLGVEVHRHPVAVAVVDYFPGDSVCLVKIVLHRVLDCGNASALTVALEQRHVFRVNGGVALRGRGNAAARPHPVAFAPLAWHTGGLSVNLVAHCQGDIPSTSGAGTWVGVVRCQHSERLLNSRAVHFHDLDAFFLKRVMERVHVFLNDVITRRIVKANPELAGRSER